MGGIGVEPRTLPARQALHQWTMSPPFTDNHKCHSIGFLLHTTSNLNSLSTQHPSFPIPCLLLDLYSPPVDQTLFLSLYLYMWYLLTLTYPTQMPSLSQSFPELPPSLHSLTFFICKCKRHTILLFFDYISLPACAGRLHITSSMCGPWKQFYSSGQSKCWIGSWHIVGVCFNICIDYFCATRQEHF